VRAIAFFGLLLALAIGSAAAEQARRTIVGLDRG